MLASFALVTPTPETRYGIVLYYTSGVGRVHRKVHLYLQFCSDTLKADI